MYRTLYDILGVRPNVTFGELKAAYYARAKQCHPDLHGDDPQATAEFQRLVNAFDILSDPVTRRNYDEERAGLENQVPATNGFHDAGDHVMDSIADDILEEMVVGNNLSPSATTLQTLMLDLVKTSHFIMFREAKVAYGERRYSFCLRLCGKLVDCSPQNILYHFYLAEAARHVGRDLLALKHYRRCMVIGAQRVPPQRLMRIRRHYQALLRKQGWLGTFIAWLAGNPPEPDMSEEERAQRAMNAVFSRALKPNRNAPALGHHARRQLKKRPERNP